MLNTLIDNTAKYTQNGYIEINLKSMRVGAWCIEVKDTGCGMKEGAIREIMNGNYISRGASEKSWGKGLMLLDQALRDQGGSLIIESKIDLGTVARGIIPLR